MMDYRDRQPITLVGKAIALGSIALLWGQLALADPVTGLNTFVPGQPATAASVNQNFSEIQNSVNDNDSRINTNATSTADNFSAISANTADISNNFDTLDQRIANIETPNFSGYSLPFSDLGSPKNVIVAIRQNGDLTKEYSLRIRYRNDTEQVQVNGVMTTPPLIARYDNVQVDENGAIISINTNIEAPATEAYLNYTYEGGSLDITTFAKTIFDDSWSESWTCSGAGSISTCDWIGSVNGVANTNNTWVQVFTHLGAGTINGMPFPDLRAEITTYSSTVNHRVRAKGIGEVIRQPPSGRPRVAIYYRVNGATGGSLTGTPFAPGQPLDGLFF